MTFPVREVRLLIVGTTYPMQSHIANARVVLHYRDGSAEETNLINPYHFDDSIGAFGGHHYAANEMVELGKDTHADVISLPHRPRQGPGRRGSPVPVRPNRLRRDVDDVVSGKMRGLRGLAPSPASLPATPASSTEAEPPRAHG